MFKLSRAMALALLLGLSLFAKDVKAQGCGPSNPNCIVTTMPFGDASNRAASDAFVQQAVAAIPGGTPGGSNGQVQFNNAGSFGGLTNAQLTALINQATSSLPGALPAWPSDATKFFSGAGTYIAVPFTSLSGALSCGQMPALTGDATSSAGACALSLATVNANVGTFGSSANCVTLTVNGKGLITAASQTACSAAGGTTINGNSGAIVGVDTNTLNAKTANYTIASTDCGNTIQAGSGSTGLFTITLPAVAGFNSACTINVKNGDTARGKILSGFPSDMSSTLWPLQSVTVKIINGVWATTHNPGRWKIPGSKELCVRQDGAAATATDGLGNGTVAADCFFDIQTAVSAIGVQWDGGGYNTCAIGVYAGGTSVLPSGVNQTGQSIGCYLTYNLRGTFKWTGAGACLSVGDGGVAIVNWNLGGSVTFACNNTNLAATGQFYCHQTCIFDFNGGTATWLPSNGTGNGTNDVFFYVDLQGSASWNASINVGDAVLTYNPANFIMCEAHCSKVTASGQLAFSALVTLQRVYTIRSGSVLSTNMTYPGVTATNPTLVSGNSVLINNGTTIPGGAITPTTGGQNCATAC